MKFRSKNKLVFLSLFFLTLLFVAYPLIYILSFDSSFKGHPQPCTIVLGAAVWGDKPSPVFRERLKFAIQLYKKKYTQALFFTGGIGKGQNISEGEVGQIFALSHDVLPQDIVFESSSKITYENLRNIKPKIEKHFGKPQHCLIVSDPFHLPRALLMAKKLGLKGSPAATPTTMYRSLRMKMTFILSELKNLYSFFLFPDKFTTK